MASDYEKLCRAQRVLESEILLECLGTLRHELCDDEALFLPPNIPATFQVFDDHACINYCKRMGKDYGKSVVYYDSAEDLRRGSVDNQIAYCHDLVRYDGTDIHIQYSSNTGSGIEFHPPESADTELFAQRRTHGELASSCFIVHLLLHASVSTEALLRILDRPENASAVWYLLNLQFSTVVAESIHRTPTTRSIRRRSPAWNLVLYNSSNIHTMLGHRTNSLMASKWNVDPSTMPTAVGVRKWINDAQHSKRMESVGEAAAYFVATYHQLSTEDTIRPILFDLDTNQRTLLAYNDVYVVVSPVVATSQDLLDIAVVSLLAAERKGRKNTIGWRNRWTTGIPDYYNNMQLNSVSLRGYSAG